jgi:hypothetical protein
MDFFKEGKEVVSYTSAKNILDLFIADLQISKVQ